MAHQNCVWNTKGAVALVGNQWYRIDLEKGELSKPHSLQEQASLTTFEGNAYETVSNTKVELQGKKPNTYHTEILVGDYYFFRTHKERFIARVKVSTGEVEYLQVPVQVTWGPDGTLERSWDKAVENDVRNNDGFLVWQDKRAKGDGWGHVSSASPVVVGDHLYMPTLIGMGYVLDWNAERFDQSALVSICDLGPAGKTWSISSLSYSDGRIYARTMKELICIESE